MIGAVAAEVLEVDGVAHAPGPIRLNRVAGLVGPTEYSSALAAVLQHFRHEGESLELTSLVKRAKDFLLASDFYHITRP